MKYRSIKKKIMQHLAKSGMGENDYLKLRKLFGYQFDRKDPTVIRSNKEMVRDAIPGLRKILYDPDMSKLFKQVMMDPTASPVNTDQFIQFLDKITK